MAIQMMNTIIKNNRNLLPKRDKFKNTLGGYGSDKKTEYNLPKATPKQLNAIRKRLRQEYQIRMLKVIGLTVALAATIVLVSFKYV
ncbi:MAG: hypothetical protein AAF901_01565 [Bacteroidota bacterium]